MKAQWLRWRDAWDQALYGPAGFYRRASPREHFRTSAHASGLFAEALVTMVHRLGLTSVVDLGAGGGELLTRLHALAPDLRLLGVELRPRPDDVPRAVGWLDRLPDRVEGLLVANEVLDNVPCDLVELDDRGDLRMVEVDASSGDERLGAPAPPDLVAWVDAWWPLAHAGDRAEVGLARDDFWSRCCAHVVDGVALAIDYGHLADDRPRGGTLAAYRSGRQTALRLDGRRDVTAHVAVDSVAAAVDGGWVRQRGALRTLGVSGERPPLADATTDPARYVRALSRATQAAELTASPGLGDFHWVFSRGGQGIGDLVGESPTR